MKQMRSKFLFCSFHLWEGQPGEVSHLSVSGVHHQREGGVVRVDRAVHFGGEDEEKKKKNKRRIRER